MTRYYFARVSWTKKSAGSMLSVAAKVLECMQGNANFPSPAVPLPDFDNQMQKLQTAYNNRGNGKISTLTLKDAREQMDTTLHAQALYVTEASKGSSLLIETSGFEASKDGTGKSVLPDMPTNVRLTSRNGNVYLAAKKPRGASSLCWIIFYGDVTGSIDVKSDRLLRVTATEVQIIGMGKYREVLCGINPGTKVTVQVLAQNAAGCSALSDAVCVYANR